MEFPFHSRNESTIFQNKGMIIVKSIIKSPGSMNKIPAIVILKLTECKVVLDFLLIIATLIKLLIKFNIPHDRIMRYGLLGSCKAGVLQELHLYKK